jgi:hypothetical protein
MNKFDKINRKIGPDLIMIGGDILYDDGMPTCYYS